MDQCRYCWAAAGRHGDGIISASPSVRFCIIVVDAQPRPVVAVVVLAAASSVAVGLTLPQCSSLRRRVRAWAQNKRENRSRRRYKWHFASERGKTTDSLVSPSMPIYHTDRHYSGGSPRGGAKGAIALTQDGRRSKKTATPVIFFLRTKCGFFCYSCLSKTLPQLTSFIVAFYAY